MPNNSRPEFTKEELTEAFDYLDELPASGIKHLNMFGAKLPMIMEFGWDKEKAARALTLWLQTYGRTRNF